MHLVGWINREQVPLGLVGQIWLWKAKESSFLENSGSRFLFSGWNDPFSGFDGKPDWQETIPENRTCKTHPGDWVFPKCLPALIPGSFHPEWSSQTGPFVILGSQGGCRDPPFRRGRWSQPQTPRKWTLCFWPGLLHPLVMGSCHLPHSSASWNVKVTERKVLHSLSFVYLLVTFLFLWSIHNIKQNFKESTFFFFLKSFFRVCSFS